MKYDVTYSCGHSGTVDLFGKDEERERKLEFFKDSGLCPECFKAKKRKEEEQIPLGLKIQILPFSTETPINLAFTGNSYPVKDEIKKLGYYFSDLEAGLFGFAKPEKLWNKDISIDDMDLEIAKVKEVFPKIIIKEAYSQADIITLRKTISERKEKEDKINAEISAIVKPTKPGCYPSGYWNKKFYQKDTVIYVDNKPQKITQEEAEEIKKYLVDIKEYNEKVNTIKNSIK